MSDVIKGRGIYQIKSTSKGTAEVMILDDAGKAWGIAAETPCMWEAATGRYMNRGQPSPLDITGPYVPPRKRVEGWVNVYPDNPTRVVHDLFLTEAEAYQREVRGFIERVYVREIDPQAEKEAREKLLEVATILDSEARFVLAGDIRHYLSLLFPDALPEKEG